MLDSSLLNVKSIVFDLFAYVFIFIVIFSAENELKNKKIEPESILRIFFYSYGLITTAIFSMSFKVSELYGFPIRTGPFFSPLVDNLHQASMILMLLPFIGLYLLRGSELLLEKFVIALLSLSSVVMTISTGSFKAIFGMMLGGVLYVIFSGFFKLPFYVKFATLMISISVAASSLYLEPSQHLIFAFQELDGGGARSYMYSEALRLVSSTVIFGRGPGAHIFYNNTWSDTHQTFLSVLLQTGVIGLCLLVYFFLILMKNTWERDRLIFFSFVPILVYALGGDLMRRLPIWLLLLTLYSALSVSRPKLAGRYGLP
jgi:hypothetical protein